MSNRALNPFGLVKRTTPAENVQQIFNIRSHVGVSTMKITIIIELAQEIQHGPSPHSRAFSVGMNPVRHKTARIHCVRKWHQKHIAAVVIKRLLCGICQAFGCLINSIYHRRRGVLRWKKRLDNYPSIGSSLSQFSHNGECSSRNLFGLTIIANNIVCSDPHPAATTQ